MERATIAKTAVEDAQREERKKREELGVDYVPRFFEKQGGHWVPKLRRVFSFKRYYQLTRFFQNTKRPTTGDTGRRRVDIPFIDQINTQSDSLNEYRS